MRMPQQGMRRLRMGRGRGGGFRWPIMLIAAIGIGVYYFSNVKENDLTGRSQFITVSEEQEVALGLQSYRQVLSESAVVRSGPEVDLLRRIGADLANAARALPQTAELANKFDWQFNLVQSDQANAFCLPGGYVAFYTGILPVAANDNGLAVIMGHEIAHALLRHGAERMSQSQLVQLGQAAIGVAAGDMDPSARQAAMQIFGFGAQVGFMLPYSREHETEADKIGLDLLVAACYDPREAPALWERMGALGGGQKPPEMFSTHPDSGRRAENFRAWMPDAVAAYEARCGALPTR